MRSIVVIFALLVVVARVSLADEPAPTVDPGPAVDAGVPEAVPDAAVAAGSGSAAVVEPPPPPVEHSSRTFAGSLQLDYLAVPTDRDARSKVFDGTTAEVSLKVTQELGSYATASVKVCFACHGFEVGMGLVELRANSAFRVRVGRMTPAFGAFPQRHDPANHLTSDKPLPYDMGRMLARTAWNEGILPAPWVDNGIEIAGTHFWSGGQIDYAVWAVSGPKGSPDAADFDFTLSRSPEQYYVDNNSEPAVGGRGSLGLELSETMTLAVGASAMAGRYDPARSLSFVIAGVDFALKLGSIAVRAEYLIKRVEMALGDDPATRFKFGPGADGTYDNFFVKDGFYAETELPVGPVTGLLRLDGLRRLGNVVRSSDLDKSSYLLRYTFGLAFRLRSKITLKTSIELYRSKELGNDVALHLGLATPM